MTISNQCKCLIHCIDIQLLENQHTVDLYCQKNIAKRLDIDQYSTAKCKGQSLRKVLGRMRIIVCFTKNYSIYAE